MSDEPVRNWSYDERQAFVVIRKAIQRKPWMAEELIKGLSEEMAYTVLKQVSVELGRLLEINQAFSAAAQAMIKEKRSGNQVPERPALSEDGQCGRSDGQQVV